MVSFEEVKIRFNCFLLEAGFESPEKALRKQYRLGERAALEEYSVSPLAPEGTRAFFGTTAGKLPKWAVALKDYVPAIATIQPQTTRFVLFIPVDDRVFAICFGYGSTALEWSAIEGNFGLRLAARTLKRDGLKEVKSRRVSSNARTQTTSLPLGGEFRDLEVDLDGEFVRKLVGTLDASGLSETAGSTLITGDSVAFDEIADLTVLQATLEKMLAVVREPANDDGFAFIDALVPIPTSSDLAKSLDKRLSKFLIGKTDSPESKGAEEVHFLELIPPERYDLDSIDSVTFTRNEEKFVTNWDERPAISTILSALKVTRGRSFLRDIRVSVVSTEGTHMGTSEPLINWIVFESGSAILRFILSFGRWFRLSEDFTHKLNKDLGKIRDVGPELGLPHWPKSEHEGPYNARVAGSRSDMVLMDMVDLRPAGGSEVESCDLFHANGHLIHVKSYRGSQDMSHHLSQGAVSAELLAGEESYSLAFVAAVAAREPTFATVASAAPRIVTWALGAEPSFKFPSGLPTFSKINLRDAARRVRFTQAEPTIATIHRV